MKRIFIVLAAGAFLASCGNSGGESATTTEAQEVAATTAGENFVLDSTAVVNWIGSKLTGSHHGTIQISEGNIKAEKDAITGGSFILNIASINDLSQTGDDKAKLEGHLKSPDFFDVAKFPTAKFEITGITAFDSTQATKPLLGATHTVSGNLTLKDSTKNVTFPAIIKVDGNTVHVQADFNIDRTQWGMNYKGPNNPQDWVISKEVNINFHLMGNKK